MKRELGVNPKKWFWSLKTHLDARPNESRAALATAAGEQWLNGELMGCLSSGLDRTLTVRSEVGKRDLTVYRVKGGEQGAVVAVIELKLVYRSYTNTDVRYYACDLLRQMKANREAGFRSVGWFGSVFNSSDPTAAGVRATFSAERIRSGRILRQVAAEAGAIVAKPTLVTILKNRTVAIGGVNWSVGLAAQYLEMK